MTPRERRWAWYSQIRDAVVAVVGVGILVSMIVREAWPPLGVITALVCVGALSASSVLRYLIGRWDDKR